MLHSPQSKCEQFRKYFKLLRAKSETIKNTKIQVRKLCIISYGTQVEDNTPIINSCIV